MRRIVCSIAVTMILLPSLVGCVYRTQAIFSRDLAHDRPTMYVCILFGTLDVDRRKPKQVRSVEKLATPELSAFKSCMVCVIEIAVC